MTTSAQAMEQYAAAAQGLAVTAGGSALNKAFNAASIQSPVAAMREIARLLEKAQKATTCMLVAQKAEADGDAELAELSWSHALDTMNNLAVEASTPVGTKPAYDAGTPAVANFS